MRFGPVNLDQGHKRLNVLFSRAKRKIDFFSSVRYSDFQSQITQVLIMSKSGFNY